MKGQVTDNLVANFVQKAFQIINNNEHSETIHWLPNGRQFSIRDIDDFQQIILPKYFRHKNIHSFIRQLNMYGFHKSRKEPNKNIFHHPFFQRDRQDLLAQVKRKPKTDENSTPTKKNPSDEMEFKNLSDDKPTALKQPCPNSCQQIKQKECFQLQNEHYSPFKGLISRSLIMDMNEEVCLRLLENMQFEKDLSNGESEDVLSIADEIENERDRFNNRTRGISIVKTSNFLDDFEL